MNAFSIPPENFKIRVQTYTNGPMDLTVSTRCKEAYERMAAKGHWFGVLFMGDENQFEVHPELKYFKTPNGPGIQEIVEQYIIDNYPV